MKEIRESLRRSFSKRPTVLVAIALIGLLAVCRFHYLGTVVIGASMEPTFEPGEILIVDKRAYRAADPQRGDLVVARVNRDLIVKRVVALPGESVEVKQGRLFVNDVEFAEPQATFRGYLDVGRGKLARGRFAILGDNRSLPAGLSVFAVTSKAQIVGKVRASFRLPFGWAS